jgi:hypothetical protein
MVFVGLAQKNCIFFIKNTYIKNKSTEKNDLVMRKSPGHITWDRVLGVYMCKGDPLKLYKIEFAAILVGWFFNS